MNSHLQSFSTLCSPPSPDDNSYTVLPEQTSSLTAVNNSPNGGHNNMQLEDHEHFHHINSNSMKYCAGCGGKILDRFFLHALDRYWHNSCLKCYCCGTLLADIGSSCYTKAGMILCKSDYTRMFGTAPCSSCGQIIAANEFVMRTTSSSHHIQQNQQSLSDDSQKYFTNPIENYVYHLKCFVCSKCASQLRPGDRYYMLAGSLVCEQDWQKLLKNSVATTPVRKGKVGRPRRSRD